MKIDIITIFPEMLNKVFSFGILGKAIEKRIVDVKIHDLRDFTDDKHKKVDDRPFGGGPGMILKPEPLFKAIEYLKKQRETKKDQSYDSHVIFLTPQGKSYSQEIAEGLSKLNHIILICGRYEGIDQRVRDELVDEEISIGNYVLSGGEIPAMVLVDSVARLVPGVIGNEEFNKDESFSDPNNRTKLDYPQYTRPSEYKGLKIPEVLQSGNHSEINKWRKSKKTTFLT